jgi:hypothetical protein
MCGGPERSRTSDLRFRKPLLYPAELRDQITELSLVMYIPRDRSNSIPTEFAAEALSSACNARYSTSESGIKTRSRVALHCIGDV